MAEVKRCTKCGVEYPATHEFFSRHARYKDGLDGWCKPCKRASDKEYRATHKEEARAYAHDYYQKNREHLDAQNRAWAKGNPDKINQMQREWAAKNPERMRERKKKYRALRKDRAREEGRNWNNNHREQRNALNRTRHARKRNAPGSHTGEDVKAQYSRQKGKCFYCGRFVGKKYHADHVIPLSLGGSNGPENIVIACPRCNMSKKDKHPMDFAGILF